MFTLSRKHIMQPFSHLLLKFSAPECPSRDFHTAARNGFISRNPSLQQEIRLARRKIRLTPRAFFLFPRARLDDLLSHLLLSIRRATLLLCNSSKIYVYLRAAMQPSFFTIPRQIIFCVSAPRESAPRCTPPTCTRNQI
jgi:hypothetical protein